MTKHARPSPRSSRSEKAPVRKKEGAGKAGQPRGNDGSRNHELVQIAYRHIAARGFEGLRVREVAAEAGINNATLHYYFPTKEDLIQGVVEYLLQEFKTARAPRRKQAEPSPQEELRLEFEDTRYLLREAPDMYVVLTELFLRSVRDPALAQVLRRLEGYWRGYLASILERGVRAGVFRSDLDQVATATAIMVQIKGVAYHVAMVKPAKAEVDRLVALLAAQTELWLTRA
jgi:AcrR family transcriptional regulator